MYRRALAFAVLVFLLLGALGVQVYRSQLQLAQSREQDQLLSIARLKVEQIASWRRERLADAGVLSANRLLLAGFREWLNGTASPAVQADLTAYIEALRRHYGYRDYLLVDATGRVRVASGQPSTATLEAHVQAALAAVQRSHAPYLTELHTDIDYPYPHLGLVVPLWQGDAPAGALILLVDAQKTLYPLLQTWPVPSATAETLLVRREGDEALFLNELRHQPDTALRLRLPLTRADLPSTQAFLGARGVVEGRDYRGVPVLAAAFPVPDTPWFVIAKIDRQELYAGVQREALLAGGGLLALLALAGALLGVARQRRTREQTQWRIQAQAAEHESLGRFRNLFEQSQDGILLLTPEHRVLDANPAALALLGYGREALAGLSLPDLLVPDEHARLAAAVARMMAGEPHLGEWRHRRADGSIFLAQVTSQRLDAGHYYATLRDVTRQRELEATQRETTRRLQLILTAATDGLWDWNIVTGEDFHSPRYRELLGYGPDELPDTFAGFEAIIHPDDLPRLGAASQAHLERREPYQVELRLRRKQGDYRWFVSRGQAEWDADGRPLRMAGFITDITERKRMEAALVDLNAGLEQKVAERTAELAQRTTELARTSERLDLAMQVTSDGVWDCNMQTEKVYCNANYFAMLGYGPDELGDGLDAVFTDLLPPEEREAIAESISQRFATEGGHESEFRMRAKDGSYRWVYARGRLIERDAAGQPLRAIGTHVDITVRKQAEEALQNLNATLEQRVAERTAQLAEAKAAAEAAARAKSEFLANMSHEIRTPMNAILGLTQILERDPLTPDQHDMLQKIGDSGAGLLHIINDILDFSKIEAGQLKVERCAFELSSVLNKVESLMTASAGAKSLGLRVEPPAGLPGPVIGDPLRIQQILLNLVGNAIKFTEQGAVTVRVLPLALTETTVRLRFEVSDTGIGIAPAPLAMLFQPFTQADASTTRRFGGTGLGLSICKRLVELMGGTIGATSEPGLGSTFWFELPFERTATAATPTDEASAAPAPAGPRLQGLRVLAVDDNRINLFMLERALKLEGVSRVQLAADGQQALQTLEADPQGFDCVLMDVQMPVMDWLTATRLIREHPELQTLPVIALTAGVMAEERERAEAAGVTGFLAKPLQLGAMVTMLRPYAPEPAVDASPPQRNTP